MNYYKYFCDYVIGVSMPINQEHLFLSLDVATKFLFEGHYYYYIIIIFWLAKGKRISLTKKRVYKKYIEERKGQDKRDT